MAPSLRIISNAFLKRFSKPFMLTFNEYKSIHPTFSEYWMLQWKWAPVIALLTGGFQYYLSSNSMLSTQDIRYYCDLLDKVEAIAQEENEYKYDIEISQLRNCLSRLLHLTSVPGCMNTLIDNDVPLKVSKALLTFYESPTRSMTIESQCIDLLYAFSGGEGFHLAHVRSLPLLQYLQQPGVYGDYKDWKQELSQLYFENYIRIRNTFSDRFDLFLNNHPMIAEKISQGQALSQSNDELLAKRHWKSLKKIEGIICTLISSNNVKKHNVERIIQEGILGCDFRFVHSLTEAALRPNCYLGKDLSWIRSVRNQIASSEFISSGKHRELSLTLLKESEMRLEHPRFNSIKSSFEQTPLRSQIAICTLLLMTPLWIRFRYRSIFGNQIPSGSLLFYQGAGALQIFTFWLNYKLPMDPQLQLVSLSILHALLFVMARFMILPVMTMEAMKAFVI